MAGRRKHVASAGPVTLHLIVSASTAGSKLNGKSLPWFCSARITIRPVKASTAKDRSVINDVVQPSADEKLRNH
ncbi:hypothetical protein BDR05DRAFT_970372 [Suillus weaverae]|nr:hypothetical protein BDR05DRAFT_970372 [Suillus weaverae]